MAASFRRYNAFSTEQKYKPFQRRFILPQPLQVETFKGVLVTAFEIKPDLAEIGDNNPIARQINGITISLIHGRHSPSRKGPIQRIARAFSFQSGNELCGFFAELTQDCISEFAVHLNVLLARKSISRMTASRTSISKEV